MLSASALFATAESIAGGVPPDSMTVYAWHSASVPPPWSYQYQVLIRTAGDGRVVMSRVVMVVGDPDVFDDIIKWKEPISPTHANLSRLFSLVEADKLASLPWEMRNIRG